MKKTIYFAVVIALLFSGCASSTEIPVSTPASNVDVVSSETSTTIPSPLATDAPTQTPISPTITMPVSSTPIFVTTAPPTGISSLLTAQATWNVCDGAEEPLYKNDLSPNGEWISVACDPHDPSKFNGAKIVKISGDVIWDVSFYDIYGIYQNGMRAGQVSVTHWTKDGNYVFLHPYFCCVDAPEYIFFNYFNNALSIIGLI